MQHYHKPIGYPKKYMVPLHAPILVIIEFWPLVSFLITIWFNNGGDSPSNRNQAVLSLIGAPG